MQFTLSLFFCKLVKSFAQGHGSGHKISIATHSWVKKTLSYSKRFIEETGDTHSHPEHCKKNQRHDHPPVPLYASEERIIPVEN